MRVLDSLSCRAQLFGGRQSLPSLLLVRVFLQPFGLPQMRPCLKRVVPTVSPLNTPKMTVSIITLNTNGIRGSDKQLRLLQWLQALSVVPDIVCLQEVHCVSDVECRLGFVLLVICLWCLLAQTNPVAVLSSIVPCCLL